LSLTCSTAEWFSAALAEHLRTINKDADTNVDKMTPDQLCALDPVTMSIHFHKKWHSIFTYLNSVKENGTKNFFWRTEYQARAAAHMHCKFWLWNDICHIVTKLNGLHLIDFDKTKIVCE